MAGNNDRIFGWNPVYRNAAGAPNLHSFDLVHGRPGPFLNRPVDLPAGGNPALDHQGHIVPQNMLDVVLDPLMLQMALAVHNMAGVQAFIQGHQQIPWLNDVLAYGLATNAPMFDFAAVDAEDKVGGFFSIVTWNPINICRAPADVRRNNYPGNNIDQQVVQYIVAHPGQQPSDAWRGAAQLIAQAPQPPTAPQISAYISACSASLLGQVQQGTGYYAFPWVENAQGVLQPA